MKRLADMDEVTRKRCSQCDYMNPEVPISKKKTNCFLSMDDLCELYLRHSRLDSRVKLLKGEMGPVFVCGEAGFVDDFSDGYND